MECSAPPHKLKLCLVGCGRIAKDHAQGIESECRDWIDVVACVDPHLRRAQEMADSYGEGCKVFSSIDQALEEGDFDAVDIMVLHPQHEEVSVKCFNAGKHVLMEKPMAPTLAECERILDSAAGSGCIFMIAEQSQYWGHVIAAQKLVQSGAIGKVSAVRASSRFELGSHWNAVLDGEDNAKPWRFIKRLTGGGIVIDGGLHWLRPMRQLATGDFESVSAVLGHTIEDMEGESVAFATLRFSSGVIGSFQASTKNNWRAVEPLFTVEGSAGEVVVTNNAEVLLFTEEHPKGKTVPWKYRHPHGLCLLDFAKAVLLGVPPAADAMDSLGELRAALAIYRSHESLKWEPIWTQGPGRPHSNL